MTEHCEVRELIIIGGGPAGYTAALYAARGNLRPAGVRGIQVRRPADDHLRRRELPRIEEGIMGPVLMGTMRAQAERFGAELVSDDVTRWTSRSALSRCTWASRSTAPSPSMITTGATARRWGPGSEVDLQGKGVGYSRPATARSSGSATSWSWVEAIRLSRRPPSCQVRQQGHAGAPPRRVPRLQDHDRPRQGQGQRRICDQRHE